MCLYSLFGECVLIETLPSLTLNVPNRVESERDPKDPCPTADRLLTRAAPNVADSARPHIEPRP
jgi:hypothetical protein